jgi:hemolysin activation/secretion protein
MLLMRALTLLGLSLVSPTLAAQTIGPRLDLPVSERQSLGASTTEYQLPPLPEVQSSAGSLRAASGLFVKQVRVEGITAIDPNAVAAATGGYENRMVSSAELQNLRVQLTRLYVDRGYVNSGVLLPDQQVKDGVVMYRAIEGSLTRVELVGDANVSRGYVAGRIKRHVEEPLNVNDLQYALRALEQDPNIERLDASLAPGDQLGEGILRVRIDDEPRFGLGLSADNHRSSSTGAERGAVLVSTRNLTGYGDEFNGSFGITEGTDEISAAFSMPFAANNAAVQLYYSKSDANIIERAFEALNIKSVSEARGIRFDVPVVEELDSRLAFSLGFESNRSTTELLGIPFSFAPGAQDGESETAVGIFGIDGLIRGASSVAALRLAYRQGFDALDATIYDPEKNANDFFNPNPTGADGIFTAYRAQATYVQRLNAIPGLRGLSDRAQFVFRSAAQLAQDPLLSLEKFAVGGVSTVRGYPENLLVRDNGVVATLECQLPVFGYRADPHPLNLVFVPFVDYGRSWDEVDTDPGSDSRNTDEARYIASAGIGFVWQPFRGFNAQVYWGSEIGDNFDGDDPRDFRETDLQDEGIHFAISYVARW